MKYTSIAVMALLGNVSAKRIYSNKQDTYDKDPDTTSMYDDLHTYGVPGSLKFPKEAPKPAAEAPKKLMQINKSDTYDKDPDTTSMYDDLHTYVKPGSGAFAQHGQRDTYDKDPNTVSMYDDLHTYGVAGSLKFPKEAPKAAAEAPKKLMQINKADTYDKDPDTTSMYDDLHTYVKPGSGAFAQKFDNYDKDPDTVSPYDDPQKRATPSWILNPKKLMQVGKADTYDKIQTQHPCTMTSILTSNQDQELLLNMARETHTIRTQTPYQCMMIFTLMALLVLLNSQRKPRKRRPQRSSCKFIDRILTIRIPTPPPCMMTSTPTSSQDLELSLSMVREIPMIRTLTLFQCMMTFILTVLLDLSNSQRKPRRKRPQRNLCKFTDRTPTIKIQIPPLCMMISTPT